MLEDSFTPRYSNLAIFGTVKVKERHLTFQCVKGKFSFHFAVCDFVNIFQKLTGHLISISAIPADHKVVSISAH